MLLFRWIPAGGGGADVDGRRSDPPCSAFQGLSPEKRFPTDTTQVCVHIHDLRGWYDH